MEFQGYRRDDGRFGVRNHVVVISSVACANGVVNAIGRAVPDAVTVIHGYGCSQGHEDTAICKRVLSGFLNNPNVGAALVVGLGCEFVGCDEIAALVEDKPVSTLKIQDNGGSRSTTEKGVAWVREHIEVLAGQDSVTVPIDELVVGLQCGASDSFSGVTANPAIGAATDLLVSEGATAILAETTEMIGTAHLLKKQCADERLGNEIEKLVNGQEKLVRDWLGDDAGMVIAPGNIEGGLSSITEKSLGCIAKGGSTPIVEIVDYAVRPSKPGLVVMDTPGYDIDSMAGLAAAGAQVILFATGRGSVAGCPAVPVIKVTSNSRVYNAMPDDMDINAGRIIDDGSSIELVGTEIANLLVEVASGKHTCTEINESDVFNYLKQGPSF